jgi:N-acetylmuramic acid 6-phosphate etherase
MSLGSKLRETPWAAFGAACAIAGSASRDDRIGGLFSTRAANPKISFLIPPPVERNNSSEIRPLVGPEVLTGSTRLKAGTATKLVLNTITTLAMVQAGKVYENLMVDLRATNDKLWDRGARIVATLTGLTREPAIGLLRAADGHVKLAVVMHRRNVPATEARALLDKAGGRLREAIE